jgi:hypothetical protein
MSIHTLRTEKQWKTTQEYMEDEKWYLINIYQPNEAVTKTK